MLNERTPLFSIIVPVYNVKDYLRQCINSILSQNFINYEILLIDDGSTDGSQFLCDEFGKTFPYCRVFHKANGGLSDARNLGLNKAVGRYIWFIDSDDYLLSKTAFGEIASIIEEKSTDVILFSYKKYYEESGIYSKSIIGGFPKLTDQRNFIRENIYKALGCNKVVKRELIDKYTMRFPVGRLGEDLEWCADLLAYAKSMVLCKSDLLAYRQRMGSITNNKDRQAHMRHMGDTLFLIQESVDKYKLSIDTNNENNLIGHYLAYEYSWLLGEVFNSWKEYSTVIKKLSFLLNYNLNYKVAKVKRLECVFGIWGTSLILNLFIKFKKHMGG